MLEISGTSSDQGMTRENRQNQVSFLVELGINFIAQCRISDVISACFLAWQRIFFPNIIFAKV
jgi:hypothetical protein